MSDLVSIIVPVYNVKDYVKKCLEALIDQSYKNTEIIVVDDGATDGSGKICDEMAKEDKRIKVYHKENGGLSSARNFGIKKAKGEYICLVDSDDSVEEDFVKDMIEAALNKKADVVVCGYNNDVPAEIEMTGEEAAVRLLTKQDNMEIVAWNKMYKRELFNDIKYPEGKNYEDTLTTYKLLSVAKKVVYVLESLYIYAEREESITKNDKKIEKLMARETAAKEAMEYFDGKKKLKEAAEIAMLTANIAFIDFALNGQIDKKYSEYGRKWVINNASKLKNNQLMTSKLKMYVGMIAKGGGIMYSIFRKIRHE